MIVLKDVLSPLEWRRTMLVLKMTKTIFGQDDYYLFKKMVMVVGFIHGLDGFLNYQEFINLALNLIKRCHMSPINTVHFKDRKMTDFFFGVRKKYEIGENFFGVPTAYIYDFNVLELDEFLTKPSGIKMKRPLEAWDY